MSTEQAARRRVAVVLARYDASRAAPEGVDQATFAAACLLDSYEVVADLIEVESGIAGPSSVAEMLWPGALHLPADTTVPMMARQLSEVEVFDAVLGARDAGHHRRPDQRRVGGH